MLTISSDLRWREHVHNISILINISTIGLYLYINISIYLYLLAKATRVLNFVRRNIYHCTSEVKALSLHLVDQTTPRIRISIQQHGILILLVIHISLTKCSVGQHGSSKEITEVTGQLADKPTRRQTNSPTSQLADTPIRRQTNSPTRQLADKPTRRQQTRRHTNSPTTNSPTHRTHRKLIN